MKIEKYMRLLEKFLKSCLKIEIIKNHNLFYLFLNTENEGEFSNIKKNYDKMIKNNNNNINNLENINNENQKIYTNEEFVKIKNSIEYNLNVLKKITQTFSKLNNQLKEIGNLMKDLSNSFKNLNSFCVETSDNENLIKTYNSMELLMQNWSFTELQSSLNMELEIKEYFKYVYLEYNSLNEMFENYQKERKILSEEKQKLKEKKEKLFKKGEKHKWGIENYNKNMTKDYIIQNMLPNETKAYKELKSYFNNKFSILNNEFEKLQSNIGLQNLEAFKNFYIKNIKVINEYTNSWEIFKF